MKKYKVQVGDGTNTFTTIIEAEDKTHAIWKTAMAGIETGQLRATSEACTLDDGECWVLIIAEQ